jgi:hypothetical protein
VSTVSQTPNFLRAAFFNAYNMSLLIGAATISAVTGEWTIAAGAAAIEAVWLALGPDLKPFQRAVLQGEREARERAEAKRIDMLIRQLPEKEWRRGKALAELKSDIERDMQHNPSFQAILLQTELEKLSRLHQSFVMLASAALRAESYLSATSVKDLTAQMTHQQNASTSAEDAAIAELARKNAQVLERRIDTVKEIERFVGRARGQMTLIENSVRLLRDQALTMTSPDELTEQLNDLLTGVDAVAQSAKDAEAIITGGFSAVVPVSSTEEVSTATRQKEQQR